MSSKEKLPISIYFDYENNPKTVVRKLYEIKISRDDIKINTSNKIKYIRGAIES